MTEAEKTSYLHRRDGIIEVLESLKGHWELAEWLSALMESTFVTPELIDGIEKLLRNAITTAKDSIAKEKMQAWLSHIEAMKTREMNERKSEQAQIESSVLENFI